tara:strand:- start:2 stop:307 length:306 start_codon:yes stop_codon:yes gene_type:complete
MLNKNTILYLLLIGSLLFLFFNNNGIVTLMKKQSLIIKQQNQIKKLNQEIMILKNQNQQYLRIQNQNFLNDNDIEILDNLRKDKGIVDSSEYFYYIKIKKN